jgi:hypothetical protein
MRAAKQVAEHLCLWALATHAAGSAIASLDGPVLVPTGNLHYRWPSAASRLGIPNAGAKMAQYSPEHILAECLSVQSESLNREESDPL